MCILQKFFLSLGVFPVLEARQQAPYGLVITVVKADVWRLLEAEQCVPTPFSQPIHEPPRCVLAKISSHLRGNSRPKTRLCT